MSDSVINKSLPSPEEMASFDRATIESGISAETLMLRAGRGVLGALEKSAHNPFRCGHVAILCGPGNNGGDGLVIAQTLSAKKVGVDVFICGAAKYSPDFQKQLDGLISSRGQCEIFIYDGEKVGAPRAGAGSPISLELLKGRLAKVGLIIDALLGTGQKEAPRGNIAEMIYSVAEVEKEQKIPIASIDIPTGVNADSGACYQPHIKSSITLTIECIKRGMLQYPAFKACGEIIIVPIGLKTGETEFSLLDREVLGLLPAREGDSHKFSYGSVLVVGGCARMPGAPVLSAIGALRAGAGIVKKAHLRSFAATDVPPELILELPAGDADFWQTSHFEFLKKASESVDVVLFGPGMGTNEETFSMISSFLSYLCDSGKSCVIDADGLNAVSSLGIVDKLNFSNAILCPHPGEMGRLLGLNSSQVQNNRYDAVKALHEKTGACVILKGAFSLVYGKSSRGSLRGFVNSSGNPYMAVPGSGDVLSGIIAAFLAQGMHPLEASRLGVYMHGAAGDRGFSDLRGPVPASRIADYLYDGLG